MYFYYLRYYIILGIFNQDLISFNIISEDTGILYRHAFINDIFNYIGIIIFSFILYKFKGEYIDSSEISLSLFHRKDIQEEKNKNIYFLNLLFILSLWAIINHIIYIIETLMIFDYWMFELLFVCLMTSKIFKIKIYIHQKLGIIINSLCCLIIGSIRFIILANQANGIPYTFTIKYKWFIPISIIIYLLVINSISYVFIKLKYYMNLKFIALLKLLIFYGIIGFIISSIGCIIETSMKCTGSEKQYFCHVYDENFENIYIENIFIFFQNFSKLNAKERSIEIFIIFIGMIFNFFSLYFDILVINNLTPMHYIFSTLIYLLFNELIKLIKNKINEGSFFDEDINKYISILHISAYFCSFIGFMIYLEIIELNFCKLNYNLRKYIKDRSIEEAYNDDFKESIINDIESEDRKSSVDCNIELSIND